MKIAIVTGGSRGLGCALCKALVRRGYSVLEFSRTAPHLYSVSLDLSGPADAYQIVATSLLSIPLEDLEEILVINNAGTLDPIGPSSKKPVEVVLANINVNFTSSIVLISQIIARFQAVPCRKIVTTISSGAAHKGYDGWSLYCAAKAGMEGYIRALALEQPREQAPFIPIIIDPNVIDTDMQLAIRAVTLHRKTNI